MGSAVQVSALIRAGELVEMTVPKSGLTSIPGKRESFDAVKEGGTSKSCLLTSGNEAENCRANL